MARYTITIEPVEDSYLWDSGDWKDYVCENFDEKVVITGNRDYPEIALASWWVTADTILKDLDQMDRENFIYQYEDTYDNEILEQIANLYYGEYEEYPHDTIEATMKIAMIINPGLQLEMTTIRGNVQGEWDYAVYVIGSGVDKYVLADWFFGNVVEVCLWEDGDYQGGEYMTGSDAWGMSDQEFADLFDISLDEIEIQQ